jgi:NAD(P)-dependent dehydrogenase (short-subunit alcohol dehydrogenase family)
MEKQGGHDQRQRRRRREPEPPAAARDDRQQMGRIVNVSSGIAARPASMIGANAYATSKAFVRTSSA